MKKWLKRLVWAGLAVFAVIVFFGLVIANQKTAEKASGSVPAASSPMLQASKPGAAGVAVPVRKESQEPTRKSMYAVRPTGWLMLIAPVKIVDPATGEGEVDYSAPLSKWQAVVFRGADGRIYGLSSKEDCSNLSGVLGYKTRESGEIARGIRLENAQCIRDDGRTNTLVLPLG